MGKSQAWRCTPVIPAPGELRQEDEQFQTSLSYIKQSPKSERQACHRVAQKLEKLALSLEPVLSWFSSF